MDVVCYTCNVMYEVSGNTCGIFVGLLSMCEVMGLHMCISLVVLDLVYD